MFASTSTSPHGFTNNSLSLFKQVQIQQQQQQSQVSNFKAPSNPVFFFSNSIRGVSFFFFNRHEAICVRVGGQGLECEGLVREASGWEAQVQD